MTLPALITRMSGRTPRFVTVAGQVVSGAHVASTSNGHFHRDHGRVTPVRRHTDHGGVPPDENAAVPWWDGSPAKLEAEAAAVAESFPGFQRVDVRGRPAWHGVLATGRGRFGVTVVHRPDGGLPHVVPDRPSAFRRREGGRYRWAPHLYLNGNLCVASQEDWDHERDDATTAVAWTAEWLATFTTWRVTGRSWPCERVEVDVA